MRSLSRMMAGCLVSFIVLFAMSETALAGSYKILHTFKGARNPQGDLAMDEAGNLYGTASYGGASGCIGNGCGAIWRLTPQPDGTWASSILHTFSGGEDGGEPNGGLAWDTHGNLYGTAMVGGNLTCFMFASSLAGCGVIWKLTPQPGGTWTESVVHAFAGPDGVMPEGNITFDSAGNLYGTTANVDIVSPNAPRVWKLSPNPDGSWTETTLYIFPLIHLYYNKISGGVIGPDGNLYGTTEGGYDGTTGEYGGTVFQLVPNADGPWTEHTLHTFTGTNDGGGPFTAPILDQAGNLYGTTGFGGAKNMGVVWKLAPNGHGTYSYNVLHTFYGEPAANPLGGLILDGAGNLYGTSYSGGSPNCQNPLTMFGVEPGAPGCGTVFKLSPTAQGWRFTILRVFLGVAAGPLSSLILDKSGHLYGTTYVGQNGGSVFEITP